MAKSRRTKLKPRPARPQKGRGRAWWRWGMRLLLALVILIGMSAFGVVWYLQHSGLPGFAKERILENLREKGLELGFSSMRWVPGEGILVEEVTLLAPQDPNEPSFSAAAIQIRLSPLQWLFQEVNIEEAMVRDGRLTMPVDSDITEVDAFEVDGISTRLKLRSRQWWELDYLNANMLGLEMVFSGSVTNAYAFSDWGSGEPSKDTPQKFGRLIKQIVELKERVQFNLPPEIRVHVDLDAKDPQKSTATVSIQSDEIQTGMVRIHGAELTAEIPAREDDQEVWNIEWQLDWDQAITPQGFEIKANLNGSAQLVSRLGTFQHARFAGTTEIRQADRLSMQPLLITGRITAPESEGAQWTVETDLISEHVAWLAEPPVQLDRSEWKARFQWLPGSKTSWQGGIQLMLQGVQVPWGNLDQADLQVDLSPSEVYSGKEVGEAWAWWSSLVPYALKLDARFDQISGPWIEASGLQTQLAWEAPKLTIESLKAQLYGGAVDLNGALDVPSRQAELVATSNFDARQIRHLLSDRGREWLDQYSWVKPPRLTATGSAILPAWTDKQPDWRGEVKPTMRIRGHFDVDQGGFRGVPVDQASSDIFFEEMVWKLPNLTIHRPEGVTHLNYVCNAHTQEYVWDIDSLAQPKALRPLLKASGKKVLDEFDFPDPVKVNGKVWGRWRHLDQTGVKATLRGGRMSYRDQTCLSLEVQGSYTNQFFKLSRPHIVREEGEVYAEALGIDASQRYIAVTNAVSTIHPMAIARAIGPATARTLEPYRFAEPPHVTMSGRIPFDDVRSVTAVFDVEGGPFSFWRFHVPKIQTHIDWDHEKLTLSDVRAPFYEGTLEGEMRLQLHEDGGASFEMDSDLSDVSLKPLLEDVMIESRESEGILTGQLRITAAETDDWGSWQGYGKVALREGRLWDTPLFGVFSRLMNAISPGLGNSRASLGNADFTITDSLIETRNLEIKERTARLYYRGSVDFDGNLDARVEAKLLRDAPMLGKVFSLALWPVSKLFEYRVTGTLGQPDIQPLYMVPKYLLIPFKSLTSMDDWLLSEDGLIPVQRLWKSDHDPEEAPPE